MKKLQIDILGKAPSIAEVERYNKHNENKFRVYFSLSLFMLLVMIIFSIFWTPDSSGSFLINIIESVAILSLFLLIVFFSIAMSEAGRKESFISSSSCIRLVDLAAKYPEVASYRDQVVAQGREFLQSEYEACEKVLEVKACREFYKVETSSPIKINTTA